MNGLGHATAKRVGRIRGSGVAGIGVGVATCALLLAACSSTTTASSPAAKPAKANTTAAVARGGTVIYAEAAGTPPDYISPLNEGPDMNVANQVELQQLLYKPLVISSYGEPTINWSRSIANKPVWSDHDTVLSFTLKHYVWSNGTPVTTRDIQFFLNLVRAGGANWGNFTPGTLPYNIKSLRLQGPYKMTITLTKAINPTYFMDNQLGNVTPIPQNVWDRESLHGKVGNYDLSQKGALKVWNFLIAYAQKTSTYTATNPIWGVIDGPYKLASFGGNASPNIFVPNPAYSGHHSTIAKLEELPFTSGSAEYDDLRSGNGAITVGYVPSEDTPTLSTVRRAGYTVTTVPGWQAEFFIPNLKNPILGPAFSQLYVRQALQSVVDETTMVRDFLHGYGSPTYGVTPLYPKGNPFIDSFEQHNPYPYNPAHARKLLASHGWRIVGGVQTCESTTKCGAGVKKGTKLDIQLLNPSGSDSLTLEAELFASDAKKAGIVITLKQESYNTVLGIVNPCTPGKDGVTLSSPFCTWQLGNYEGWQYGLYPSGGEFLLPSSEGDAGQFNNNEIDTLIHEVRRSGSMAVYHRYENLVATQLPFIWQPDPASLVAVAKNLRGPGLGSEFNSFSPNRWYFAKS
jgi:peptide/nickel transport system substrate-binding protein